MREEDKNCISTLQPEQSLRSFPELVRPVFEKLDFQAEIILLGGSNGKMCHIMRAGVLRTRLRMLEEELRVLLVECWGTFFVPIVQKLGLFAPVIFPFAGNVLKSIWELPSAMASKN